MDWKRGKVMDPPMLMVPKLSDTWGVWLGEDPGRSRGGCTASWDRADVEKDKDDGEGGRGLHRGEGW